MRVLARTNISHIKRFLASRRAAGPAIPVVAAFIIMSLVGIAFVGDHNYLVQQRDALKAASAAAGLATALRMNSLDSGLNDAELKAALIPTARRYILANLPEKWRARAAEPGNLSIRLTPNRAAGTVDVRADAALSGIVFGRWLGSWGWSEIGIRTQVAVGTERIENVVELVLAIDVTGSMSQSIYKSGPNSSAPENKRIEIVRQAALSLLDTLSSDGSNESGRIAVGLVPFNTTVNITAERHGWVSDHDAPHKDIPPQFGPWGGCIEHRPASADLDLSLATPSEAPFTMWFSPSTLEYRPAEREQLALLTGGPVKGNNDWEAVNTGVSPTPKYGKPSPHFGCPGTPIVPLTTDLDGLKQTVRHQLEPWPGGGTMSHLGVVWGRRLLAPEWRDAWGDPRFPLDWGLDGDLMNWKVLVLLTDGLNATLDGKRVYPGRYLPHNTTYVSDYTGYGRVGMNAIHPPGTESEGFRAGSRFHGIDDGDGDPVDTLLDTLLRESCEFAKQDGIEVFTISAVPQGHKEERSLQALLTNCATSPDHAFVHNSSREGIQDAFRTIAQQLVRFRRIY